MSITPFRFWGFILLSIPVLLFYFQDGIIVNSAASENTDQNYNSQLITTVPDSALLVSQLDSLEQLLLAFEPISNPFARSIPTQEVIDQLPDSLKARTYCLVGWNHLLTENLNQAKSNLEQALDRKKDLSGLQLACLWNNLGSVYVEDGNYREATTAFSRALQIMDEYQLKADKLLAQLLINSCDPYFELGELDLAYRNIQRLQELVVKAFDETAAENAIALKNLSIWHYYQSDYESSLQFCRQALKILGTDTLRNQLVIADVKEVLGLISDAEGDFVTAEEYHREVLTIRKLVLGKRHPDVAESEYNIGHLLVRQSLYAPALDHFLIGLTILKDRRSIGHPDFPWYYHAIGVCYRSIGDYYQGEEYLHTAAAIRRDNLGDDSADLAVSYVELGRLYMELGEIDKALTYLHQALDIRLQNTTTPSYYLSSNYNSLGVAYGKKRQYDQAVRYLEKALTMQRQQFGEEFWLVAVSYNQLGGIYLDSGQFKKAAECFDRAIALRLKLHGPQSPYTAVTYSNMAILKFAEGQFETALEQNSLALKALNFTSVARLDEVNALMYVGNVLNHRAGFYQQQYKKTNQTDLLHQADSIYTLTLEVLQYLKSAYQADDSKIYLVEEGYHIFEGAINVLYELDQVASGDPQNMAPAFELSERSKANILKQTLSEEKAREKASLSERLLEREKTLKETITYYRNKLHEASLFDTLYSFTNDNEFQQQLFQAKEAYNSLLDTIEATYPDYYRLKYDHRVMGVRAVQDKLLEEGEALVEYFVGDSSVFINVVQKTAYDLIKVPLNDFPLLEYVHQMRSGIFDGFSRKDANRDSLNRLYVQAATVLYQKLFRPVDDLLSANTSITIVPDGHLGYIPFEALLTQLPGKEKSARDYPYLLRKYSISYAHSATLLWEMQQRRHNTRPNNTLLAFAPTFPGRLSAQRSGVQEWTSDRFQLGPLKYNIAEVQAIGKELGGTILEDQKATKENFLRLADDYKIIHLSTHGRADDQMGEYSFVVFYDSTNIQNGCLYASDLYQVELNADLVVLSACETGIGELKRGEGIISLARGFSHAGAKSIVSSLWKVDDNSTSQLLVDFYRHLKAGMTKKEALRLAKLDYLAYYPDVEPYFWAGFIAIGDTAPLSLRSWNRAWWLLLAIPALWLLGWRASKRGGAGI